VPEPDTEQWPALLRTLVKGSGVPSYDGLVVVARKGTIVDHAPLLRRFVQALARGYRAARANPVNAVQNLGVQVPALASSAPLQLATVEAALPYFFPSTGQIWGWQAPVLWNTLGTWMMNNKVISDPNALTDASTNELLQGEGV
jgi:ABC-type nitrate/sulfonate/bicarbonate transport system substrate-binding protein